VPVPDWVKAAVDEWLTVACIEDGLIFRCVTHKRHCLGFRYQRKGRLVGRAPVCQEGCHRQGGSP
jgi:hypothetical protein